MIELNKVRSLLYETEDEEPIVYCNKCLSLAIKILSETENYCDCCGSTATTETNIHTWEKMYEGMYGHKYLNND